MGPNSTKISHDFI